MRSSEARRNRVRRPASRTGLSERLSRSTARKASMGLEYFRLGVGGRTGWRKDQCVEAWIGWENGAPLSIHSEMAAMASAGSLAMPKGMWGACSLLTTLYNRLALAFPRTMAGPCSPPLRSESREERSSPDFLSFPAWQGRQLVSRTETADGVWARRGMATKISNFARIFTVQIYIVKDADA